MLALSMVVGITGAWFTSAASKDGASTPEQFGKVEISLADIGLGSWANTHYNMSGDDFQALPGSVYTIAGTTMTNSSDVDIYVYVTIAQVDVEFTLKNGVSVDHTSHGKEAKYVDALVGPTVATVAEADGEAIAAHPGMYHLKAGKGLTINGGSVTLAKLLENKYQEGSVQVKYSVTIHAIQAANLDADQAFNALDTGWNATTPDQSSIGA